MFLFELWTIFGRQIYIFRRQKWIFRRQFYTSKFIYSFSSSKPKSLGSENQPTAEGASIEPMVLYSFGSLPLLVLRWPIFASQTRKVRVLSVLPTEILTSSLLSIFFSIFIVRFLKFIGCQPMSRKSQLLLFFDCTYEYNNLLKRKRQLHQQTNPGQAHEPLFLDGEKRPNFRNEIKMYLLFRFKIRIISKTLGIHLILLLWLEVSLMQLLQSSP